MLKTSVDFAYDILRRFFIEEPSREYLALSAEYGLFNIFPDSVPDIKRGLEEIKLYLEQNDPAHVDEAYEALHWDYTRLFIGPMSPPAPIWASYYLEQDHLLFQNTTLEVRTLYQKYGFAAGSGINAEADDHIGYELDFLYRLNLMCSEADEKTLNRLLKVQADFIANHMLLFVEKFSDLVITNANTGFYRGLARILPAYLKYDLNEITDIIGENYHEKD